MVTLQNVSYHHSNREHLFRNINLTINHQDKVALIGNNGTGKSTLLQLMAGKIHPTEGKVTCSSTPYYIPQAFGQFNHLTIAGALRIQDKLNALHAILNGDVSGQNMEILNEDWTIEDRCQQGLSYWELENFDPALPMSKLSGGQITKVFLAGIYIHQPEIVLLDEPGNHLDSRGKKLLSDYISSSTHTMVLISHDRTLLNLFSFVYELDKNGITGYGGNYDFYAEQKKTGLTAMHQDLKSMEKALRKAKETERETAERKQKRDARGKKKQEKAGLPTISMNTLRNHAEKSTSRIKEVHAEKVGSIMKDVNELRNRLPEADKMKFEFDHSALHKGKILVSALDINYSYGAGNLWTEPLHFEIRSGDRIALKGKNGSGKSTLIRLILGEIKPVTGTIYLTKKNSVYIDQDYSIMDSIVSVYDQAQKYNNTGLPDHEIGIRLNRFLFTKEDWNKPTSILSGGERMKLMLCCLTIGNKAPDLIVLDEPTNNLDIQNINILASAINDYKGTLIVVSHDQYFLNEIRISKEIELD